ncbi:Gfo/Idh/MocA family protein [Actinomadura atramentaria]|uniref:Gfo/Idh/MocA family protein n=1 Tax=Actinomadura atramentaria TaxID=1990 RepID=UPI00037145AE|nr:Gfo/Idh/MocA family oxidoreductase [Actinomadura atramentaria]
MRVAFAGLATTYHPGADARLLRARGVTDLVVWGDADGSFAAEHGARPVDSPEGLVAAQPDAAIVTLRPADVPGAVRLLAGAGVPTFVTKPAVGTAADLDRLDEAVGTAAAPVTTCSVLRFAPALRRLAGADVLGVRVTVRHSVTAYLDPGRRWLDDPAEGGGTLATMGLHGVELASAVLGPGFRARWACRAARVHRETWSEDTGVITLTWPDGRYGVVEVLGATDVESYEIAVHTPRGTATVTLPDGGDDPLGYAATLDAFLAAAAEGRAAVPWTTTREVLGAVVSARNLARPGRR